MGYSAVGQTASYRDVQTTSYTSTPPTTQLPSCATAEEKRQAEIDCLNASLRGLGSVYPSGSKFAGIDPCQIKNLATCPGPSLLTTPMMSLLQQPAATPAPITSYAAPVPTSSPPRISAVQQPSTATAIPPAPAPQPVPSMAPPPVDRSNLIIGGIIAAVVVTGGYLVYRTTKRR